MDEGRIVPRAPAEEGQRLFAARGQGCDLLNPPDVMLVGPTERRLASLRVALVGEVGVTVDRVVTAPLQFLAHRCLAGATDALDEEVALAHGGTVAVSRWPGECNSEAAGDPDDRTAEISGVIAEQPVDRARYVVDLSGVSHRDAILRPFQPARVAGVVVNGRADQPGCHCVDTYSCLRQLLRQSHREGVDAGLRRRVVHVLVRRP